MTFLTDKLTMAEAKRARRRAKRLGWHCRIFCALDMRGRSFWGASIQPLGDWRATPMGSRGDTADGALDNAIRAWAWFSSTPAA